MSKCNTHSTSQSLVQVLVRLALRQLGASPASILKHTDIVQPFCSSKTKCERKLMSVSVGCRWRTRPTVLSWPGNTWHRLSLSLAVSSTPLSGPAFQPPLRVTFPGLAALPGPLFFFPPAARIPLGSGSGAAPPGVRSRYCRTSVLARGSLEAGKGEATPAKEWLPG